MTQATSSLSPGYNFPLPQELVDHIVDQVAYASGSYDPYGLDQPDLGGLIACSLICHSFYPRARAQLDRHICLKAHMDKIDERASRVLESIRKRADALSIPVMQSLSLVIHDSQTGAINRTLAINHSGLQRESPGGLSKLIQHSQKLACSHLHHFSLVSRCVDRKGADNEITPTTSCLHQALLGVFTNTNLKTLHLVNIASISLTQLTDVFFLPHLVELTLNSLTFAPATGGGLHIPAVEGHKAKNLAPSLRRLEMRHIPQDQLLLSLNRLISASTESSSLPGSWMFPKLQNLIISLNFDNDNIPNLAALSQLGALMERNSSTLKTLEFENYGYPDVGKHFGSSMQSRIPLSKLPELRNLQFTIRNSSSLDFLKRVLGDLVRGCKVHSPFRGSFQNLELKVVLPSPEQSTLIDGATICQEIIEACSLKIDTILSSPHTAAFSGLENLKILIILFHRVSCTSSTPTDDSYSTKICLMDLEKSWKESAFPRTMATNRVNLTVQVRHIFSEDTMDRYLKYACCTKDS